MTELLANHVAGRWQHGTGPGTELRDPVLGTALVWVDATGLNLPEAFAFAREQGGAALRAGTYRERAAMLGAVAKVLQAHSDSYYDIATANSGTVKTDSAVDIDGGIFTLGQYARWGDALGDVRVLRDEDAVRLGKEPVFQSQHLQVPRPGVALCINAFNFPAWGLWEKAAPALLSGMPVIVKPGTSTAWLTQRMVQDVVNAAVLPAGALSVIAGSSAGLMDALQPFDVISFTGSAETAGVVRAHPAVALRMCSSAGEALPAEVAQRFKDHFGCDIIDGIGSTEMLHISLSNRPGDVRYGTTGKPVSGYEISLRGDDGSEVPQCEIGDLYIQGPSAALMYWNNRAKTRETFQGAWTKSGDKYVRDAGGYNTYAGRSDDMLKVSGIYVSPFEVEATLMQHTSVLEAPVIGTQDADGLTKTKAFVVLKDGQAVTPDELKAFVKERLAPYKYPRLIEYLPELPKTATGKIQRFRLREREQRA